MSFLGKKDSKAPKPSAGATAPAVTHRLTKDLASAESLARMIAASRASAVLEVSDYLAGMYIYGWERFSKFWENQEAIENLLQHICQISPQRWHHWMEFYHEELQGGQHGKPVGPFGVSNKQASAAIILEPSSELKAVLQQAEHVAPYHDSYEGRSIPILTSECVLLCIANSNSSEIGEKLREAGLDMAALEQAARHPKHAPLHGGENR
jgi:hypothetical protein